MRFTSSQLAVGVAVCLLGAAGSGKAGNPTADQMIQSLLPTSVSTTARGIRPLAPASPAPAAGVTAVAMPRAAAAPSPAAVAEAAPSVNLTVQFSTNSADLTPAAVHTLNELGRALSSPALASYRFRIEGHTDTVGTAQLNKSLSERRAATVVEYLSDTFGVAKARLEPVGMGQDGLLVPTPPETPEAKNRRVQVINLGA